MAHMLKEDECGLTFGTQVTLKRSMLRLSNPLKADVWLVLSADQTGAIKLKFDRAGYNHYDGLYAYCFKLPSSEEVWIELEDGLTIDQRVSILKDVFDF